MSIFTPTLANPFRYNHAKAWLVPLRVDFVCWQSRSWSVVSLGTESFNAQGQGDGAESPLTAIKKGLQLNAELPCCLWQKQSLSNSFLPQQNKSRLILASHSAVSRGSAAPTHRVRDPPEVPVNPLHVSCKGCTLQVLQVKAQFQSLMESVEAPADWKQAALFCSQEKVTVWTSQPRGLRSDAALHVMTLRSSTNLSPLP